MRSPQRILPFLLLLLATATATTACKKKDSGSSGSSGSSESDPMTKFLADSEKKKVASIEEKLKYVEGLRGKLAPPTTKDGVTLDPKDWVKALWVHEVDMADLNVTPKGSRVKEIEETRSCAKEARTPDFGKRSVAKMDQCDAVRYFYIVRTLSRTEPKVTAKAAGMETAKFSTGVATGDVLVYDVRAKQHVGGFLWKATNDNSVTGENLTKNFEDNILENIRSAYIAKVKH